MLRLVQPRQLLRATGSLLQPPAVSRAAPATFSRSFSTTRSVCQQQDATASSLDEWTRTIKEQTTTMHDTADLNKARQLLLVLPNIGKTASSLSTSHGLLDKYTSEEVLLQRAGSPMPLGSELVLFNPLLTESTLGSDGTERPFGPPGGLDQRMWASGSFEFEQGQQLKIGQDVQCDVSVESVLPKEGAKTGMMVFVTRKLVYSTSEGTVMTERRTHVYRKQRPADQRKYTTPPPGQEPKALEGKQSTVEFGLSLQQAERLTNDNPVTDGNSCRQAFRLWL